MSDPLELAQTVGEIKSDTENTAEDVEELEAQVETVEAKIDLVAAINENQNEGQSEWQKNQDRRIAELADRVRAIEQRHSETAPEPTTPADTVMLEVDAPTPEPERKRRTLRKSRASSKKLKRPTRRK